MHRSGTSATTGMLQEYGLHLGPVSESNRFNPRGNREMPELIGLHDRILRRHGGTWWKPPPGAVVIRPSDRAERDEILASIEGDPKGVKDPRMLVVGDLWRDLEMLRIGVFRNPIAVRESLEARATLNGRKRQPVDRAGWERLWCIYNHHLLALHMEEPFPLINFDRPVDLDAQVRSALLHYTIHPKGESQFFDPSLARRIDNWRSDVIVPQALDLYDRLAERAQ
jgi:hypothetical protein